MFRFIHFSDNHLGDHLPAKSTDKVYLYRGNDFLKNFLSAVDYIINTKGIDFVIHTGDLFETSNPPYYVFDKAVKALKEISRKNIPFFIIKGNHEINYSFDFMKTMKNMHIFEKSSTYFLKKRDQIISLTGINYIKSAKQKLDGLFLKELEDTEHKKKADIRILMLHQLVERSIVGPNNYAFRRFPEVLSLKAIPQGFDYIACGHLHRPQKLNSQGKRLFFSGSTERITFQEIGEKKGFLDVKIDKNKVIEKFIELPVRPMHFFKLDFDTIDPHEYQSEIDQIGKKIVPGSYCRISITGKIEKKDFEHLNFDDLRIKTFKCHLSFSKLNFMNNNDNHFFVKNKDEKGDNASIVKLNLLRTNILPQTPGIFILKNNEVPIFIGTSENIKKAVFKTMKNLMHIPVNKYFSDNVDIEVIRIKNEVECLYKYERLLEKYNPELNHFLEMGNAFIYIITEMIDNIPFLSVSTFPVGNKYIGPLPYSTDIFKVFFMLQNILSFPLCFGENIKKHRSCSSYILKNCISPCRNILRKKEYMKKINELFEDPVSFINSVMGKEEKNHDNTLPSLDDFISHIELSRSINVLNGIFFRKASKKYFVFFIIKGVIIKSKIMFNFTPEIAGKIWEKYSNETPEKPSSGSIFMLNKLIESEDGVFIKI